MAVGVAGICKGHVGVFLRVITHTPLISLVRVGLISYFLCQWHR